MWRPGQPRVDRTARCASTACRPVQGSWMASGPAIRGRSALRPADFVEHRPKRARLHLRQEIAEHLEAGRAGGDDLGLAEDLASSRARRPSPRHAGLGVPLQARARRSNRPSGQRRQGSSQQDARRCVRHARATTPRAGSRGRRPPRWLCGTGLRRAKAAASERLCAMSRSGEVVMGGGHVAARRPCPGALRGRPRPCSRSFGQIVSHRPHSVQLSIIAVGLAVAHARC